MKNLHGLVEKLEQLSEALLENHQYRLADFLNMLGQGTVQIEAAVRALESASERASDPKVRVALANIADEVEGLLDDVPRLNKLMMKSLAPDKTY